MATWARERLSEVLGTPHLCSSDQFVQMFSVELPAGSIDRLGTRLWDEHQVEVPMVRWNGREFMRVSIQAYNKVADVERLVAALKTVL